MAKKREGTKLNDDGTWEYGASHPPELTGRPDAWNSRMHGPTWIAISFNSPVTIDHVSVRVNQSKPGLRIDVLWVEFNDGIELPIEIWRGMRKQGDHWESKFEPVSNVIRLKIKTHYIQNSWVAWSYVEVFGK
jgi:hypothetical protein